MPVGAVQQRQVGVARRLVAERLQHEQLLRRVGEVVVTADHVGDPHLGVVDGDGEVVEDRAVAAGDDEVVVAAVGKADRAVDEVVDDGLARRRARAVGSRRRVLRRLTAVAAAGAVLAPSRPRRPSRWRCRGRRRRTPAAAPGRPRGGRRATPGRRGPRPSRAPASRSASRICSTFSVGRALAVGVLDPQDQAAAARGGPRASCRVPSSLRRCAAHRSARERIESGGYRSSC